jgi:hypothetical protein
MDSMTRRELPSKSGRASVFPTARTATFLRYTQAMKLRLSNVLTRLSTITAVCGALACSSSSSSGTPESDGGEATCPATPTTCPSPAPSYKSDVEPLIAEYCYQCHSTAAGVGFNGGKYDWTQLSNLQSNGTSIADEITATNMCNMPYVPDNPTSLPSAADRTTIAEWAGPCMAPNN